jgi:hypothetical protein
MKVGVDAGTGHLARRITASFGEAVMQYSILDLL